MMGGGYPGLPPARKKESGCSKAMFILLNVVLMICGLLTLAVGLYLRIMKSGYPISLVPDLNFYLSTTILTTPGVTILLTTILGFCGSAKYGRPYMIAFIVTLTALFLIQIVAVVVLVMYKPTVVKSVEDMLILGIGRAGHMKIWDDVQRSMKCCGVYNYTNWQGYLVSANPQAVPDSCCKAHLYDYPGCGEAGGYRAYEQGCISMLITWVEQHIRMVGGGGIGFAAVQIFLLGLGLAIVCCGRPPVKDTFSDNFGACMPPGFMVPQNPMSMYAPQYPDMAAYM